MIYFDNAATTYPKPKEVRCALKYCIKKCGGNPGRSSHTLSEKASEIIYSTREKVAKLLHTENPENVVFTYNATHALNIAIKAYATRACHIITSDIEHNSVIRPLEKLKKDLDIEYSVFNSDRDINEVIPPLINDRTTCIVSTLASNVTGKRINISSLSEIARERGLYLIIDASQAVGHTEINLSETPCDVLCAPAHKALFGIQGAGFALFRENSRRETLYEGGSGYDSTDTQMPYLLPEGYEAGTLGTPAIAALGGGIDFVEKTGMHFIEEKIQYLTGKLIERISSVKGSILYPSFCGIVGFNLNNFSSSYTASALAARGICTRGGLHCAPSAHRKLGTCERGLVRLSLSCVNTVRELDVFYKALKDITC